MRKRRSLLATAGDLFKRLARTKSHKKRKYMRYAAGGLVLFFLYSCMSGTYGIPRIIRLAMERDSLLEANRKQAALLIDQQRIREYLRNDASYIEYIARTRYYMAAPDETIYRFRGR